MSDEKPARTPPPPPTFQDALSFLDLHLNPDGSLTRPAHQTLPAAPDPTHPGAAVALSKDIPLNSQSGTFIRLFRPRDPPPAGARLPLIIDFHGGGFILYGVSTTFFHEACNRYAAHIPAVVASVEYRIAPEHRLPAAYDDGIDAVEWARTQARGAGPGSDPDPWLEDVVDFTRVFLMGGSAGGNIVYHVGLRAVDRDLRPMRIAGLVMNQPFFGGVLRTESELRGAADRINPPHVTDMMWTLALPKGADRGHEYCDPAASVDERAGRLPACVVRGYSGDPLVDRQRDFSKLLELRGATVTEQFIDGGHHAVELFNEKFADEMFNDVRDFIRSVV